MKKKIQIVLISLNNDNQKIYRERLEHFANVSVLSFSTLHQFHQDCHHEAFSGIIMDIRTLIRSTSSDKNFYSSLTRGFPILQVDLNQDKTDINCFIEGEKTTRLKGKKLWDYFVTNICRQTKARGVRLEARQKQFYNTFLHLTLRRSPVKTNLCDISTGGCFVISTDKKKSGSKVSISIQELQDKTPIICQIQWSNPWGSNIRQLPGFGTSFQTITPQQKKEIKRLVSQQ